MATLRPSVAFPALLVLAALLTVAPSASSFVAWQTSSPVWADAETAGPYTGVYDPDGPVFCLALSPESGPFLPAKPYYGTLRLAVYGGVQALADAGVQRPLPPPLDDCAGLAPDLQLVARGVDSHAGHAVWQATVESLPVCTHPSLCTATYHVYEWSSCTYTHGSSGLAAGLPFATASKVACTNELCDPLLLAGRGEVHYGMYVWLHDGGSHEADGVPHLGLPDHGPHSHESLDAFHLCEPEEEVGGVWVDRNAIVQVCLEVDYLDFITGAPATAFDQDHFALLNSEADPLDTAAFLEATVLDPSTWSNMEPDVGC